MANIKASNFTTQTSVAGTDLMPFVRPGSPNTNNKITATNFFGTAPAVSIPIASVKDAGGTAFEQVGTFSFTDASGAGLSITTNLARYEKVGRLVTCYCSFTYPATASGVQAILGGLPFTSHNSGGFFVGSGGIIFNSAIVSNIGVNSNATTFNLYLAGTAKTNVSMTGVSLSFTLQYLAAA